MARISGVDIPREKRLEVSLTYIFGIGRTTSQQVCDGTGIDRNTRVRDLTDEEVVRLRGWIDSNLKVSRGDWMRLGVDLRLVHLFDVDSGQAFP